MRRGAGLVVALAALALVQVALADPTTFLATQLKAGADPPNCGEPGEACCLRKPGPNRCNTADLVCMSGSGANPRCVDCGGENEPACRGQKCDKGFVANDRLVCVAGNRKIPAEAKAAAKGATAKDRQRDKAKRDNDIGKRLVSGAACAADADCATGTSCVNKACMPCGGKKQACCPTGLACKDKGGKAGKAASKLVCEFNAKLGANMCRRPSEDRARQQQEQQQQQAQQGGGGSAH